MSCNDKRSDRCVSKIDSFCVDYEGTLSEQSSLKECNNLEDVIEDVNNQLSDIHDSILIEPDKCIYNQKKVVTKEAIFKLVEKLQEVMEYVGMGCDGEYCNPFFTEDITCVGLDYKCLVEECAEPPSTLADLIGVIIARICPNCEVVLGYNGGALIDQDVPIEVLNISGFTQEQVFGTYLVTLGEIPTTLTGLTVAGASLPVTYLWEIEDANGGYSDLVLSDGTTATPTLTKVGDVTGDAGIIIKVTVTDSVGCQTVLRVFSYVIA